jgi:hypothetical protein
MKERFIGLCQNITDNAKLNNNNTDNNSSYESGFSTNKYRYNKGAIKKLDENTSILWLFIFII